MVSVSDTLEKQTKWCEICKTGQVHLVYVIQKDHYVRICTNPDCPTRIKNQIVGRGKSEIQTK